MQEVLVKIWARRYRTKVVLEQGGKQQVRAVLPAVTIAERQAARTLLTALALWYQRRLFVVLYVDEQRRCSEALQLYEDIGNGERTLYYEVVPVVYEGLLDASAMNEMSEFSDLLEPRGEVLR
jgi:hypothetical protein